MKWLILVLVLVAAQEPDRTTPREGPWAGKAGHFCWKHPSDVFQGRNYHQCGCKMICDEHGNEREDFSCQTSCKRKEQCVCHDEGDVCEAPR